MIAEDTVLKPGDWVRQINDNGNYENFKLGQWEPRMNGYYVYPEGKDFSYSGVGFTIRKEYMILKKYELLVKGI